MRERPLQQAIVLTQEHSDVDRQVRSFTTAVAVRENRDLETVSVAMRVEGRAEELRSAVGAVSGVLEMTAVVGYFPKQSAVLVSGKLLNATPELPEFESLPIHNAAD